MGPKTYYPPAQPVLRLPRSHAAPRPATFPGFHPDVTPMLRSDDWPDPSVRAADVRDPALVVAWSKLHRASELLQADQATLHATRDALQAREVVLKQREESVAIRESEVAAREQQLAAATASPSAGSGSGPATAASDHPTRGPFGIVRSILGGRHG